MPRPESLRLRTKLIAEFEQLAERFEHGNAAACGKSRLPKGLNPNDQPKQ